jgi:hypothetical protein
MVATPERQSSHFLLCVTGVVAAAEDRTLSDLQWSDAEPLQQTGEQCSTELHELTCAALNDIPCSFRSRCLTGPTSPVPHAVHARLSHHPGVGCRKSGLEF